MKIENENIKVSFIEGTTLESAVLDSVGFCISHKTEVKLNFNGTTHTITRFTDQVKIINNWYK